MKKIKFKDGAIVTFDGQKGWQAVSDAGKDLMKLLNSLWSEHYGAESAVYYLTVEGLHVQAILKLFEGKIIGEEPQQEESDPNVVY